MLSGDRWATSLGPYPSLLDRIFQGREPTVTSQAKTYNQRMKCDLGESIPFLASCHYSSRDLRFEFVSKFHLLQSFSEIVLDIGFVGFDLQNLRSDKRILKG